MQLGDVVVKGKRQDWRRFYLTLCLVWLELFGSLDDGGDGATRTSVPPPTVVGERVSDGVVG